MGYRSQGVIVIHASVVHMRTLIQMCRLALPAPQGANMLSWDDFKMSVVDVELGELRYTYEGVKWYDTYPDVRWVHAVWSWFSERGDETPELGVSGVRVRIGEDDDDKERHTFGEDPPEIYLRIGIDDCTAPSDVPLFGITTGDTPEGE
jgi:hypothetical protein